MDRNMSPRVPDERGTPGAPGNSGHIGDVPINRVLEGMRALSSSDDITEKRRAERVKRAVEGALAQTAPLRRRRASGFVRHLCAGSANVASNCS